MWNLLIPAGMAVLSAKQAEARNEQQKAQNLAQAEKTRYSAWSGLGGGQINNSYADPLMSGLGGGLQGLSFMQGFNNSGGWKGLMDESGPQGLNWTDKYSNLA